MSTLTEAQQEDLFAAILFDTDQDECGEYAETEATIARMIADAEQTARAEVWKAENVALQLAWDKGYNACANFWRGNGPDVDNPYRINDPEATR